MVAGQLHELAETAGVEVACEVSEAIMFLREQNNVRNVSCYTHERIYESTYPHYLDKNNVKERKVFHFFILVILSTEEGVSS